MSKLFLIMFLYVTTLGCSGLVAYTIGTVGGLTADVIKEKVFTSDVEDKTIVIKEKDNECKDCKNE